MSAFGSEDGAVELLGPAGPVDADPVKPEVGPVELADGPVEPKDGPVELADGPVEPDEPAAPDDVPLGPVVEPVGPGAGLESVGGAAVIVEQLPGSAQGGGGG